MLRERPLESMLLSAHIVPIEQEADENDKHIDLSWPWVIVLYCCFACVWWICHEPVIPNIYNSVMSQVYVVVATDSVLSMTPISAPPSFSALSCSLPSIYMKNTPETRALKLKYTSVQSYKTVSLRTHVFTTDPTS